VFARTWRALTIHAAFGIVEWTRELVFIMCRNALFALTAVLMAVPGHAAFADPAYRASDIVKHFAPRPDLGATRGLCIGTEGECNSAIPTARPGRAREAFDLIVTFDLNSDVLTESAKANLDEFSKALRDPQLASASFLVEGHTDATGSDNYNMTLSERRAASVVRYLREKGIDTTKLEARGYGKTKPRVADPFDPTNRRVETRLRAE
jgi:outer membrane protein OmpA-like peptidoglycan-associated protein